MFFSEKNLDFFDELCLFFPCFFYINFFHKIFFCRFRSDQNDHSAMGSLIAYFENRYCIKSFLVPCIYNCKTLNNFLKFNQSYSNHIPVFSRYSIELFKYGTFYIMILEVSGSALMFLLKSIFI